jgi:hypothetical protein
MIEEEITSIKNIVYSKEIKIKEMSKIPLFSEIKI